MLHTGTLLSCRLHGKMPDKLQVGFALACGEDAVHHHDPSVRHWSRCIHTQEAGWWMLVLSELSPLYEAWDPWPRDGAIHISGDGPPSVNLIQKLLGWHAWSVLAKMISEPIKCTININPHTYLLCGLVWPWSYSNPPASHSWVLELRSYTPHSDFTLLNCVYTLSFTKPCPGLTNGSQGLRKLWVEGGKHCNQPCGESVCGQYEMDAGSPLSVLHSG